MITNQSKFIGLLKLNTDQLSTDYDNIITQKEDELLVKWFGYALAKDIQATTPSTEAQVLIDGVEFTDDSGDLQKLTGLTDILPYFMYFYISRDLQSDSTTLGQVEAMAENATKTNPVLKLVQNYNIGVKLMNEQLWYVSWKDEIYTTANICNYLNVITQFGF